MCARRRNMSQSTLDILTSAEVIAVNQDPLGIAGDLVWKQGPLEVRMCPACSTQQGNTAFCEMG